MPAEVRPSPDLTDDFTIPDNTTRLSRTAVIRRGDQYSSFDCDEWLTVPAESGLIGRSTDNAQLTFPIICRPVVFCRPNPVVAPMSRSQWRDYMTNSTLYTWYDSPASSTTGTYQIYDGGSPTGTATARRSDDGSYWQVTYSPPRFTSGTGSTITGQS